MSLVNEQARIVENACVGPSLFVMALDAPAIAARIEPGQFVHMRVPRMDDHVLRRPFSVYAADAAAGRIEVLYQTVGFGTEHMATLEEGLVCELIGPVGRGWRPSANVERALLVAGGVGAAPLFMLAEELVERGAAVTMVLGAQTKDALVCRGRYEQLLGAEAACNCDAVRCSTDDGSFGRAGFCTSLVEEALAEGESTFDYVAVCGPEPLMRIVADKARAAGAPCEVSLERRMACGVGACLSCVVDTQAGKQRACVDGPVFDAREVVW